MFLHKNNCSIVSHNLALLYKCAGRAIALPPGVGLALALALALVSALAEC